MEAARALLKLHLRGCGLTDAHMQDLAAALQANKTVADLDLSRNKFGYVSVGAALLCSWIGT